MKFLLPLTPFRTLGHQPSHRTTLNLPLLQPAINLIDNILCRIIIPINTDLIHTLRNVSQLQQLRLLDRVNIQSRANMPRNMAMERPDAWVIGVVLQNDVAGLSSCPWADDLHVAALGVLLVDDGAVPETGAFGEDVEVVAVEMHGVGGKLELVVDD